MAFQIYHPSCLFKLNGELWWCFIGSHTCMCHMYVNNACRYCLTWAGLLVTLIFFRNVILDVIRAGSSSVHWCLSENRVAVLRSSVT